MIELILAVETVLLCLIGLLVLGLLRSHAEILRRLDGVGEAPSLPEPGSRAAGRRVAAIAGVTPGGDARSHSFRPGGPGTLLAFLSSGCSSCRTLIDELPDGNLGVERLIVVTKDPAEERPSVFRSVAGRAHVLMSSQAWRDFEVPGSPYFAYVDGASGTVVGEGSAPTWTRVGSLLRDAVSDAETAAADSPTRVTASLRAAGVEPGDPSLYPSRA